MISISQRTAKCCSRQAFLRWMCFLRQTSDLPRTMAIVSLNVSLLTKGNNLEPAFCGGHTSVTESPTTHVVLPLICCQISHGCSSSVSLAHWLPSLLRSLSQDVIPLTRSFGQLGSAWYLHTIRDKDLLSLHSITLSSTSDLIPCNDGLERKVSDLLSGAQNPSRHPCVLHSSAGPVTSAGSLSPDKNSKSNWS